MCRRNAADRSKTRGEPSGHIVFLNHHTNRRWATDGCATPQCDSSTAASPRGFGSSLTQISSIVLNVKVRERRDPLGIPQVQQTIADAERVLGNDGRVGTFIRLPNLWLG